MKVRGTNIVTKNDSGLTKELFLERNGVKVEIMTTKRGLAISVYNGKIIQNCQQIQIIPKSAEVHSFETLLVEK